MRRRPGSSTTRDLHGLEERRRAIRGLLEENPRVAVHELARRFDVSTVTIRSDLNVLHSQGALTRVHGGALPRTEADELPIDIKQGFHPAEKARIAAAAAAHIRDGQTIILDSGSTTSAIARRIRGLGFESLTVITNALNIAVLVASVPFVALVVPGGHLRRRSWSLSGPMAERALRSLRADTLFLGADSFDAEGGLRTPHAPEAALNARMIASARRVIAVTDSSKLRRRELPRIAGIDRVDLLITDRNADTHTLAAIRARGVEVQLA
jgi:DeoR family transcriptional regulator of aga operon